MVAVAVNETSPETELAGRYRRRGIIVAAASFVVQKTMDRVMPLCWRLSRPRRDGENSIFRTQPLQPLPSAGHSPNLPRRVSASASGLVEAIDGEPAVGPYRGWLSIL